MQTLYKEKNTTKEIFQIFNETMEELFLEDEKVVYLDADLMGSMKTQELWKKYPKNVFNCGIQEANMVGVAAGLYLNGFKPYIHSFSPFISRRVFDQAFLSVAYAKKSVRIYHSPDDFFATEKQISRLKTFAGDRLVCVSNGSHLGFLYRKEFQEALKTEVENKI